MVSADDVRALRGTLVNCDFSDGAICGLVLRAVTPAGEVVLADQRGHETRRPFVTLLDIEDARPACESCGERVNYRFAGRDDERQFCSNCARRRAFDQPAPVMHCPECGREPAFYSPRTHKYGCAACQGIGGLTGLGVELRVLQAQCRSSDIDSPSHEWKQIRGQWICRTCQVKVRTRPAHATGPDW